MTQRAFYSINDDVLSRFNALVPARKRSKTVQQLIAKHVSEQEDQILRAVMLIQNDPEYAAINDVSADADAWALEIFERLEANEEG